MLAVDVVLLPERRVAEKAIELNRRLSARFGEAIVLGTETCLPHISFAMGCIDEADIGAISKILSEIASEVRLSELEITGIAVSTNSKGQKVSCLEILPRARLAELHEEVMRRIGRFFKGAAEAEHIAGRDDIAALEWINNYRTQSSFDKFRPHITIGYGELELEAFADVFRAEKLALCHLGNHCTCARVLWEADI